METSDYCYLVLGSLFAISSVFAVIYVSVRVTSHNLFIEVFQNLYFREEGLTKAIVRSDTITVPWDFVRRLISAGDWDAFSGLIGSATTRIDRFGPSFRLVPEKRDKLLELLGDMFGPPENE